MRRPFLLQPSQPLPLHQGKAFRYRKAGAQSLAVRNLHKCTVRPHRASFCLFTSVPSTGKYRQSMLPALLCQTCSGGLTVL